VSPGQRRIEMSAAAGLAVALIVGTLGLASYARAEEWPQRPVKVIVPFPPGGMIDGTARIVAQRLGRAFGQQFIVENRPGASGAPAAEAVVRAPADGYTLFVAALPQIAILPALSKPSYNPVADFAPISKIATSPFVLVVNPNFPAKTLSEFVAHVRGQSGNIAYASVGVGTLTHLSMALFLKRAGLEMIHVTYKSTAPISEVIAGHVPAYFSPLSDALPQAQSGALRLLAVSSEHRAPLLPDVPTIAESGYPGFKTITWTGLMMRAGTPAPIIDRIATEIARAVKEPEFAARLRAFGIDPVGNGPEELAATISADIALWENVVREAGISKQ
jgi:tripartite-type tricarboxylate transporter receptor subunit TctC